LRDNGAIEGAAGGFSEDDSVIVQLKYDRSTTRVVAHVDGVRACGWVEMWDEPATPTSPLLCKNHRWSTWFAGGPNEWCPAVPVEYTTVYGTERLELEGGVCSLQSTGNGGLYACSGIELDCTGTDAPVLNQMIMKIKSTTTPGPVSGGGCCFYLRDSEGQGQYINLGAWVGVGIYNGVDSNVGVGNGSEKIIDLSIFRPVSSSIGFAKGPLQALRFESWSHYAGVTNVWSIDYIEIL